MPCRLKEGVPPHTQASPTTAMAGAFQALRVDASWGASVCLLGPVCGCSQTPAETWCTESDVEELRDWNLHLTVTLNSRAFEDLLD